MKSGGIFLLSFTMLLSVSCSKPADTAPDITVANPSFESGSTGWNDLVTGDSEYYAPVDGNHYAVSESGAGRMTQVTGTTIESGKLYTLAVWARSIYSDSHTQALSGPQSAYPQGNPALATAEVQLTYDSTPIASVEQNVSPVALQGCPKRYPNDDGGNVWIDQGYRMEFADSVFHQPVGDDPILDPWLCDYDGDYDHDMAVGPIITPQGLKALYNTYYNDSPPFYSEIWLLTAAGDPPDYEWSSQGTILSHNGDEDPWVIDAHLLYDDATDRLWMSWGGGSVWVTEVDPDDGRLMSHPDDPEFDTHPDGTHTEIALWNGDEWTGGNDWFEGPALYKHDGYWYLLASYGNLGTNYTIRMGRGSSPTGPFFDKEGVDMMEWDSDELEYGNSFLLGDDGDHLCPGHPHVWEEDGDFYMGYDYRDEKDAFIEWDTLGIRRLYWVNDWPTIWTPIEVAFNADDHPEAIGQKLGISLGSSGEASTFIAFDLVDVKVSSSQ